ncbi:sugar transferase [Woeseiaceae bacterium]|nr:sugar transferase [Woeseiaceae bacterium]
MKRLFDILFAVLLLILVFPVMALFCTLIFLQDFHSPFYLGPRVGKNSKNFYIIKLRSMIIDADRSGVDSTSSNDSRITYLGHVIRKFKIDELPQLINVIKGEMSFVGPRPQMESNIARWTEAEKKLLSVRPGATDFSSIVFSDEGDILLGKEDLDVAYNQLIRPWKSRLGLIYIKNQSIFLDIKLIIYTAISIVSRSKALELVVAELKNINADNTIIQICKREHILTPELPPVSDVILNTKGNSDDPI